MEPVHDPESKAAEARVTTDPAAIPVVSEEATIGVRRVATGGLRVHKRVHEHEELVDQPLRREKADIRRVVRNEVVSGPLPVRQEGDTTIIPVVEEVLVFEKRWVLKEELHITKQRFEERRQERVVLRREDADVERFDAEGRTTPVDVRDAPAAKQSAPPASDSDPLTQALRARRPRLVRKNKIIK